jgi:hypothetical protein
MLHLHKNLLIINILVEVIIIFIGFFMQSSKEKTKGNRKEVSK